MEEEKSKITEDVVHELDGVTGKKLRSVPKPELNTGIDTNDVFTQNIVQACIDSKVDFSEIQKFTTISQRRDELFSLIDTMGEDSKVQSVMETYAEDATETNDSGQVVWAESSDASIAKYVNFLLDNLNVDRNIYTWIYSLCKYGDIYVRLFRQSEVEDDLLKGKEDKTLNEQINYVAFQANDKYAHYVEMVPNPAEVFELTKFGKSYAYIKAPVTQNNLYYAYDEWNNLDQYNLQKYRFHKDDIEVYPATEFVHASLNEGNNRFPEKVDIFRQEQDWDKETTTMSYSVRRGQSILYPAFKVWRQLQLLENSVLLNRVTKSSLTRVLQIEVGDMPKEQVRTHLQHVKQLIEQKQAINVNSSMSEYTNPGPIENNVYVPTHGGVGVISTVEIGGGDPNVKDLADLDYYLNLYYGTLRVPKQYFAQTDDSTGFNGGTSLSLVSSRYARTVKRVQQSMIQMVTDLINLMLVDKGLDSYINKFQIRMQAPTTQEDLDRREKVSGSISMVSDIMNVIGDIEDPIIRLRIIKELFANNLVSPSVCAILQKEIDKLEKEAHKGDEEPMNIDIPIGGGEEAGGGEDLGGGADFGGEDMFSGDIGGAEESPAAEPAGGEEEGGGDLPSMNDLGKDFADNSQF